MGEAGLFEDGNMYTNTMLRFPNFERVLRARPVNEVTAHMLYGEALEDDQNGKSERSVRSLGSQTHTQAQQENLATTASTCQYGMLETDDSFELRS